MDFQKLREILPKDPLIWSQEDVLEWLKFIGLDKYAQQFKENTIDGSCLNTLTSDDLQNHLKIDNAIQRKKILNWISVGIQTYSQYLKTFQEESKPNQIVLSELNQNSQQIMMIDKIKANNFKKMQSFEETNVSNHQSLQNFANEDKYLFEMNTNNVKQSFKDKYQGNAYKQDNQRLRLPVCNSRLDSSSEEDKENIDEYNQGIDQNLEVNNNISECEDSTALKNVLIIEPVEGIQTNFFCVKEEGGKIGRHSSNQILILEESISRYHAEIVYHEKKFFIKDIGSSTGTFIKVKDRVPITLGMLFEMGSFQFEVSELDFENQIIELDILEDSKPTNPKHYKLEIKNSGEQPGFVSIGRKPSNKIKLPDDQHLSNVHAKIYFMNNQFFLEDNASTNGTWIRLSKEGDTSQEWEIQNNTIIKIGSTSSYNCRFDHEAQKETLNDACFICFSQDKDAVFLPCRHNSSCIKCSKTLQVCPICRTKIEDVVKIFKA
ncbi:hypothetical protein ABPG72_015807 [Tetrahymena utriculariae]